MMTDINTKNKNKSKSNNNDTLKVDIETHTLEELKELYKLPKTKINKLLQDNNLTVKYIGRTPYTNGLIPLTTLLAKYQKKDQRQKTNEIMYDTMDYDKEIEVRKNIIKDFDYKLGYLLSQLNDTYAKVDNCLKGKNEQEFMVDVLNWSKETKDWCGFVEEERYGIRPEVKELKELNQNILSDEMVLGYLSTKISPNELLKVKEALDNSRNNNNNDYDI